MLDHFEVQPLIGFACHPISCPALPFYSHMYLFISPYPSSLTFHKPARRGSPCGVHAFDCALRAPSEVSPDNRRHNSNLGPLVCTNCGFCTCERVPGSGGLGESESARALVMSLTTKMVRESRPCFLTALVVTIWNINTARGERLCLSLD